MERSSLLAAIPLFESLSPEDLATLATKLEERRVQTDEAVFLQGDPGKAMFIIRDGAVDVCVGEGKAKVVLASLFTGQFFGEMSLLDGAPRSATAIAIKPTTLLSLDHDDFVEFIMKNPKAALSIMAELGERMRHTNEIMSRQVSRNVIEEEEERLTFGQRIADHIAKFGGSWTFIGAFCFFMALWMGIGHGLRFDVFPFIFLNLMLSTVAALQAPVIMMSQNRQSFKDKLLATNDYQVNLKSEIGIDKLMKGQAELLQRMATLERLASANGKQ
jgi:uncharacterized membrane protein